MLGTGGVMHRPDGPSGFEVRAVPVSAVRTEFYSRYVAEELGTKRKAFTRFVDEATAKQLIASREVGPGKVQHIWFVEDEIDIVLADTGEQAGHGDI